MVYDITDSCSVHYLILIIITVILLSEYLKLHDCMNRSFKY